MKHPEANSEAYSEPCQTSKMEVFTKIVNGFSFLTIFAKSSKFDKILSSPVNPEKTCGKSSILDV